jgi:plastocyanin
VLFIMRSSILVSALLAVGALHPAGAAAAADGGAATTTEPPIAPAPAAVPPSAAGNPWLGEQLPLPLQVKTPQDLALKAVAERQYLIFNLLARGKLAWDGGDFAVAAAKWDELLRIPGLDPELDRVIRPLASEARSRAGSAPSAPGAATGAPLDAPAGPRRPPTGAVVPMVSISGEVTGGGSRGPEGSVIWLRRADGATPRPAPVRGRGMVSSSKAFVPRVLPVTVGSTVTFTNKDNVVHNVFSLSASHPFDGGLSKTGQSFSRTFSKPGAVEILCNIHASEQGHVVVIDSPWYTEANSRGAFVVRGLPPGDYDLEAWHESASQVSRMRIRVGVDGLRGVAVKVGAAKDSNARRGGAPDKTGQPRP